MDSSAEFLPPNIRAGDNAAWVVSYAAFPASAGWQLHYRLLWPSVEAISFDADAQGDDHAVSLTGADTATWHAGTATLVWWVTLEDDDTDTRHTLGQCRVHILPDLTTAATLDPRSINERALADAQAALAAYMASGRAHVAEYQIAGRQMKFRSADELRALIEYYQREVATERARALALDGVAPGRILTRF
jgi:hypothetical protein